MRSSGKTPSLPALNSTRNGVTNAGRNEDRSDFNSPVRDPDGALTMALQLRGTQVVSTPEPASIVLASSGAPGFGRVRRRRRARSRDFRSDAAPPRGACSSLQEFSRGARGLSASRARFG